MSKAQIAGTDDQDNPGNLNAAELYRLGTEALNAKKYARARQLLKEALELKRTPDHMSQYALALAHDTGDIPTAITLCQEAVKMDPKNPEHFLRLGTVYLIGGRRKEALRILRLGLRVGRHTGITKSLQTLGNRGKPMLPFLSRANPLNKYLGKLRGKLRMRLARKS